MPERRLAQRAMTKILGDFHCRLRSYFGEFRGYSYFGFATKCGAVFLIVTLALRGSGNVFCNQSLKFPKDAHLC